MGESTGPVLAAAALLTLAVLVARPSRQRPTRTDLRAAQRSGRGTLPLRVGGGLRRSRSRPGSRGPLADGPVATSDQIASAMVLLAVALQSGCGVVEAVEQVADVGADAAAVQLGVVAAALRWGLPDAQAWAVVDPRWSRAELSLRLAAVSGVAPSSMLLDGADDLRTARLAQVDMGAARVGVRLVLPLGLAFLPAFVLTTVVPVVLALTRQVLAA